LTVFAYEFGDRRVSVLMLVKLARIFHTSVEELAGLKMTIRPKCRLSPAGVRHAECYQKLSKTEQRFVKKIIDTLLERVAARVDRLHLIETDSVTTAPVLAGRGFLIAVHCCAARLDATLSASQCATSSSSQPTARSPIFTRRGNLFSACIL
jgi:hypothetical protein